MERLSGLARDGPVSALDTDLEPAKEREADRTADAVLSGKPRGTSPAASSAPRPANPAPAWLAGNGTPMSLADRNYFEPRLGQDLSDVRVHTGAGAARATDRLNADAFTYGRHIAFAPGAYAPQMPAGRHLIAHELAHVAQQGAMPAPVVQRKGKARAKPKKDKPQIVAITAVEGELRGEATLSPTGVVPITLTQNQRPAGQYQLLHVGNGRYRTGQSTSSDELLHPTNFEWLNPYIKGTKEPSYDWAELVDLTITQSPAQRIQALPAHIRRLLTTDQGEVAGTLEIEEIADAGELLVAGGVTDDEIILLEEQARAARERGDAAPAEVDAYQWAQGYLKGREGARKSEEENWSDLIGVSKKLKREPLFIALRGGLGSLVKPGSDKEELANILSVYDFYRSAGRVGKLPEGTKKEKYAALAAPYKSFQKMLLRFETLLLQDLRRRATAALDAAEASILRMDKSFTGIWQSSVPSDDYFWREIKRINESPVVKRAATIRDEGKKGIDKADAEDLKSITDPYSGVIAPLALIEYDKRADARDEQKEEINKAFTEVVRENSQLKLPPGVNAQRILAAGSASEAVSLLKVYITKARSKIGDARTKITDPKFIFAADIWLEAEKADLKTKLGGANGSDIAGLVDQFASFRKSETSFWEEVLSIVEFVSMFVPGPIGWGLRAGIAVINFDKTMEKLNDQRTRYLVGASSVDASSSEALMALADLVSNLVPEAPAARQVAAERRTAEAIEHGGVKAEQVADNIVDGHVPKSSADAPLPTTGHADIPTSGAPQTPGANIAGADAPGVPGAKAVEPGAPLPDGPGPAKVSDPAAPVAGSDVKPASAADPPAATPSDPANPAHGGEKPTDIRGKVEAGRNISIMGADEVASLSLDDLRRREMALVGERARVAANLDKVEHDIATLEERIEDLKSKQPRRGPNAKPLAAETNLAQFRDQAAAQRAELERLDTELATVKGDLEKVEPPKPKVDPPAPVPVTPIGEVDVSANPTTYGDTGMHSWRNDVYLGTTQSGYRNNVETILLKDKDGPLSKALLENGKIVPHNAPTGEFKEAHRELFEAGHARSNLAGDKEVIVLTSAHRNAEFSARFERHGERMSEFAYVIQGIAVEQGTAWELVKYRGLPADVVEKAQVIRIAK